MTSIEETPEKMDSDDVTSVHDDDCSETAHKLTTNLKQANQMKQNRSHFQCYHNNKRYCKFRSECRYQHYKESCQKTICKDQECKYVNLNLTVISTKRIFVSSNMRNQILEL